MGHQCRICLEEDSLSNLIRPWRCSGTQAYTHVSCLMDWQSYVAKRPQWSRERFQDPSIWKVCQQKFSVLHESAKDALKRQSTSGENFNMFKHLLVPVGIFIFALFGIMIPMPKMLLYRFGEPVPELHSGVILKARPNLGGFFNDSIILITNYSIYGAQGYILNKPLKQQESDLYQIGGPVDRGSMHVLHTNPQIPECKEIIPGLYLGGKFFDSENQKVYKVFSGYSGWAPLQLDGEVRAGVWTIEGDFSSEMLTMLFNGGKIDV